MFLRLEIDLDFQKSRCRLKMSFCNPLGYMTKFSLSLWECYICTEEKCGLKFPHFHTRYMLNLTTPSRIKDALAVRIEWFNHSWICHLWLKIIPFQTFGELIYTCKMIQPGIFSRFSQPVNFSRFKPYNFLLSTARFSGYNLEKIYRLTEPGKNDRLDHFTLTGTD